jgi:hypothetical protein
MIKFLATRRWNYIDIFGLAICVGFGIRGQWLEWVITALASLILSCIAERKAGIE